MIPKHLLLCHLESQRLVLSFFSDEECAYNLNHLIPKVKKGQDKNYKTTVQVIKSLFKSSKIKAAVQSKVLHFRYCREDCTFDHDLGTTVVSLVFDSINVLA